MIIVVVNISRDCQYQLLQEIKIKRRGKEEEMEERWSYTRENTK
jgi:hypothetical protein